MPQLTAICQKWQIVKMSFFGSVMRDDFGPDSDIDILVTFGPDSKVTLFDMVDIRDEFAELFGRKVDLLTHRAVRESRNPYRQKAILESAEDVYAV